MNIDMLLDLEKDLRDAECFLQMGIGRGMNCIKDESWFDLMEGEGFLVDGKFLSIIDILVKTKGMNLTKRTFTLESVGCDLSLMIQLGW